MDIIKDVPNETSFIYFKKLLWKSNIINYLLEKMR